jgi:plastocyanin
MSGVAPVSAASSAVQITDGAFKPATLTVAQGDVVTWTNGGAMRHTVTADDGSFDSGPLSNGDAFGNLFDTPGTFAYHDSLDATMKGIVIVRPVKPTPTPSGTPAPTPPPGTLPPDFKTPPPVATPGPSATASSVPSASPTGASSPPGNSSIDPERPVPLLIASIVAAIAGVGLWILGRRQDTPGG